MSQKEYEGELEGLIFEAGGGRISKRKASEIATRFVYRDPQPIRWAEPEYISIDHLAVNLARYELQSRRKNNVFD